MLVEEMVDMGAPLWPLIIESSVLVHYKIHSMVLVHGNIGG